MIRWGIDESENTGIGIVVAADNSYTLCVCGRDGPGDVSLPWVVTSVKFEQSGGLQRLYHDIDKRGKKVVPPVSRNTTPKESVSHATA